MLHCYFQIAFVVLVFPHAKIAENVHFLGVPNILPKNLNYAMVDFA